MQLPTIPDPWRPIPGGNQYLNVAVSTALTVPPVPTAEPAKGAIIVGVLTAQNVAQWIRTDATAVTAALSGGRRMAAGDFEIVYGQVALGALRVIREGDGGSLAVEYYYFRPGY